MIQAYIDYWKNYANFKGQSSRSDYWWVFLANLIIVWVLGIIGFTGALMSYAENHSIHEVVKGMSIIPMIAVIILILYLLATIIPHLSLVYRRIKDTGLSGWWFLVEIVYLISGNANHLGGLGNVAAFDSLISLVAAITLIVIYCQPTGKFDKKN